MKKLKLYGDSRSGNCYKVQLLCAEMDIEYDWEEVDILSGDTRTAEFLMMNPNGRIPLLELPDGKHLAESNAILCYLADGSEFLASEAWSRAISLQWMFFEQYSHEPYIATSRFIIQYLGNPADKKIDLGQKRAGGISALGIMEQQLGEHDYVSGVAFNVADIALFAHTHIASEGGFDLDDFPNIRNWIKRIESRSRHIPMVKK